MIGGASIALSTRFQPPTVQPFKSNSIHSDHVCRERPYEGQPSAPPNKHILSPNNIRYSCSGAWHCGSRYGRIRRSLIAPEVPSLIMYKRRRFPNNLMKIALQCKR